MGKKPKLLEKSERHFSLHTPVAITSPLSSPRFAILQITHTVYFSSLNQAQVKLSPFRAFLGLLPPLLTCSSYPPLL